MIILEQLIFNIIAFTLFVIIFLKIIQRNDTSYVISLILEAIGIILSFFQLVINENFNIVVKIIIYALAILLPAMIIILEKRNILFMEIVTTISVMINMLLGKNKIAKRKLNKLVNLYPQSYIGHKLLAQIYEKEGGIRKALEEYIQLVEIKKTDYKSYYKVAEILNTLEKKDEAAEMLNTLLQKQPDNSDATQLLGEIDGLKYNPTNYDMNYNLAVVYTMLNDFQNAKMYYEKAAFLNTLEYNSQYSLAEIALIYKELEEAEKYFLETSQNEELEADSYFELARISIMKAEKEKAINYANLAIESDPKKIVEKIRNDSLFITIMTKINIPLNLENLEGRESKLGKKEQKVKKHLEETFEITRHLGYNNMRMSKKEKNEIEEKEQNQEDIEESKEREGN